jgi:predicted alpha-1,2-mannosidase
MRLGLVCVIVVALGMRWSGLAGADTADASPTGASAQADIADLVDPFVGTGVGPVATNEVGTFPGADVPFGMVQWSPDTAPDRAQGGGYNYGDTHISGFSLTHLSGAGCAVFGDVPILPMTGAIPDHPGNATEPFSHGNESASPGRYQVGLGSPTTMVRLSATTRTGIGQITFPATHAANLLFKVSGSATGLHASSVQIHGDDEVTGSVTTGYFCGSLGAYSLHFVAVFDRPFEHHGTWSHDRLHPGTSTCSGSFEAACGAWVTFDTTSRRAVTMKVGVSYVSTANAASNLKAEDPGWRLGVVQHRATALWNAALDRIQIHGGTRPERQVFYTALYHSLLDPSVFSDDNGQYEGFDGRVHNSHGRVQYANFSEWDIYRSEIPLLSMIDPSQVSDMVQSLMNDASQSGWLPKWAIADFDAGVMNGDSADPVIADAYAFGVRGFDAAGALKAMLKGADQVGTGPHFVQERQNLAEYEKLGYVQQHVEDQASLGVTIGASETLEYAIDDFAIAQMARAVGDQSVYRSMMLRAQNWQNLFNPATGYVQARLASGAFPPGPAFPAPSAALVNENQGQEGFTEGNAIQYTWSVPQDPADLFALMGGDSAATASLNAFFSQLSSGPFLPYDWPGDEPSLWTPWEYDFSGAPARAQQQVRSIADSLYSLTPAGEPGNDDLGALSSWYVWAALGLYPLTPGSSDLVIASPIFPSATIHLAQGKTLTLTAPGAPAVYVDSMEVATGSDKPEPWNQTWLPGSILHTGGVVGFTLGTMGNTTWGTGAGAAPPSYAQFAAPAVGYTLPSGSVLIQVGSAAAITLGLQSDVRGATTVRWSASSSGVKVVPSSGQLVLPATSSAAPYPRTSTTLQLEASSAGTRDVHVVFSVPGGSMHVPSVTFTVNTK